MQSIYVGTLCTLHSAVGCGNNLRKVEIKKKIKKISSYSCTSPSRVMFVTIIRHKPNVVVYILHTFHSV